jgi:hypothetical protein
MSGIYKTKNHAKTLCTGRGIQIAGSTHLWNVGLLLRDYTALYPKGSLSHLQTHYLLWRWDADLYCIVSLCGRRREITLHFTVPQLCLCCGVFTCKSDVHFITWKLIHQVTTWKGERSGGQSGFSDSSEAAILGNAIYLSTCFILWFQRVRIECSQLQKWCYGCLFNRQNLSKKLNRTMEVLTEQQ